MSETSVHVVVDADGEPLAVFDNEPAEADIDACDAVGVAAESVSVVSVPWISEDVETCFRCQRAASTTTIDGRPVCDSCIDELNDNDGQGRDDRLHGLSDFEDGNSGDGSA